MYDLCGQCDYALLFNFNNIREGYRLAHRGKTNTDAVIEFDSKLGYNLNKIKQHLINKEWDQLFHYYTFTIKIPKERIVDALTFEGRIVQHVLCDTILASYFEPRLVKENCACRVGKGTSYAIKLLRQHLADFQRSYSEGYVLKIDVKKFFSSIDRSILKKLLSSFPNEEVLELLYYLIDSAPGNNGLPIGNQTSQWFALYYLNSLDRIIKEKYRIKYYVRYMDDLIIIHNNKNYLQKLLADLVFSANKLNLQFNGKTQITPLKRGFNFLGWRFYCNKNKKIIQRVSNEKRKLRAHKMKTKMALQQVYSLQNYLEQGNTYLFRKIYGMHKLKLDSKVDKYIKIEACGVITKISEVKETSDNQKWGYLNIQIEYGQRIKAKIFDDSIIDIIHNFKKGNLIKIIGEGRMESYKSKDKEKDIYELVIYPSKIEKLQETTKQLVEVKL